MVLEDGVGERVAIVQLDMGHPSPVIHRLVAGRLVKYGLGSDRLFLAVTHTHSGPGNIFMSGEFNRFNTPLAGYDDALVGFLVDQITLAVESAVADMRSAKAAWGWDPVPRATVNRSVEAHRLNPGVSATVAAQDAVDDTLLMLRVDQCDEGRRHDCRAKGAFSILGIHSTSNPLALDVVDADLHARVARRLEEVMEDKNHDLGRSFASNAFHLIANGAEGDVAPAWLRDGGVEQFPDRTRCDRFWRHRVGRRPGGPRSPRPLEEWSIPTDRYETCVEESRLGGMEVADEIHRVARQLYERLGTRLSPDLTLKRAFTTLDLPRTVSPHPLCEEPNQGLSFLAGADDGRTRLNNLRIFGIFHTGIAQGERAVDKDLKGCDGAKRLFLAPLRKLIMANLLPRVVQFGALRIGDVVLAAVPGEATTRVGYRIKESVRSAVKRTTGDEVRVGILGLTNSYMLYVATKEEYELQFYEGGGTLYGPNSEGFLSHLYGQLAASLATGPIVQVTPISGQPGDYASYFRRRTGARPAPSGLVAACSGGVLTGGWIDARPGDVRPADGQLVEITGGSIPLDRPVWDDHPDVEVRALGPGGGNHRWRVVWKGARVGQSYQMTILGVVPARARVNCS